MSNPFVSLLSRLFVNSHLVRTIRRHHQPALKRADGFFGSKYRSLFSPFPQLELLRPGASSLPFSPHLSPLTITHSHQPQSLLNLCICSPPSSMRPVSLPSFSSRLFPPHLPSLLLPDSRLAPLARLVHPRPRSTCTMFMRMD